jgi:hypothetical protein
MPPLPPVLPATPVDVVQEMHVQLFPDPLTSPQLPV